MPGVCPAGHPQEPILGGNVPAIDANGNPVSARAVLSGARPDRPGRCHKCGAVLSPGVDA